MMTNTLEQPVARGSAALIWTLVTRAIGLTAGLAVALLIVAALLSMS
jgi:tetrahydromethanopterin S-methyltransferase subunit F